MIQNTVDAGFDIEQVEILTQRQFDERKATSTITSNIPTDKERIEKLENMILMLMEVI